MLNRAQATTLWLEVVYGCQGSALKTGAGRRINYMKSMFYRPHTLTSLESTWEEENKAEVVEGMTKSQGLGSTKNQGGSKLSALCQGPGVPQPGSAQSNYQLLFFKHHSKLQPCTLYSLENKY